MNINTLQPISRIRINIHSCMEFNLDAEHHTLELENGSGPALAVRTPWFREWELIRSGETATLTFKNGITLPVRIVQVINLTTQIRLCCETLTTIPSSPGVLHA